MYRSIPKEYAHGVNIVPKEYVHGVYIVPKEYIYGVYIVPKEYSHGVYIVPKEYIHGVYIVPKEYAHGVYPKEYICSLRYIRDIPWVIYRGPHILYRVGKLYILWTHDMFPTVYKICSPRYIPTVYGHVPHGI